MKTMLLFLRLALWWPVGQISRFLLWVAENPFIVLYVLGFVCWWNALYTMGRPLELILGQEYGFIPLLACMFLMATASFPWRLARVLLVPLVIFIEIIL